jgi:hypothetical protein
MSIGLNLKCMEEVAFVELCKLGCWDESRWYRVWLICTLIITKEPHAAPGTVADFRRHFRYRDFRLKAEIPGEAECLV